MKRRPTPAPNLTSLLDVLFILVFASLVHAASQGAAAAPVIVPAPAPPAPPPPPALVALRDRALADLSADLAGRPTVIARVSRDGVLIALELADRKIDLGVPLIERVPDPDIAIAYLGDRSAELRICRIAALRLGVTDLARYLIVITADAPLGELTVALVTGLRDDAARCLVEQRGVAVLIDPSALAPPVPSPPP